MKKKKIRFEHIRKRETLFKELIGIKARFQKETGEIIEFFKQNESEKNYIGHFAGIRLMMPIIETLADMYYPKSKFPEVKFLKYKLKYEAPNLIWHMYRHTLIHKDVPSTIRWGKKTINWQISIGQKHLIGNRKINIDITQLYDDIENFLIDEIRLNSPKKVLVEYETKIINPTNELIKEINLTEKNL